MKRTLAGMAALAAALLLAGCAASNGPKEIQVKASADGFEPARSRSRPGSPRC